MRARFLPLFVLLALLLPPAASDAAPAAPASVPPGPLHGLTEAKPMGDVTGDGLEDLLALSTVSAHLSTRTLAPSVLALDGATGSLLWRFDLGVERVLSLFPMDDVTGDGRPDVLLVTERPYAGAACPACLGEGEVLSLRALSGLDGSLAWIDERVVDHEEQFLEVEATDDHDADGVADVVVRSREGPVPAVLCCPPVMESRVVSAATGQVLLLRSSTVAFGRMLAAGDAVGGPADDLVWSEETVTSLHVELIDGDTLLPTWTQTFTWGGDAQPLLADVTGDAAHDLIVRAGLDSFLLSGATGTTVWHRPIQHARHPTVIGALGGGPGDDLLVRRDSPPVLERVDGATGITLFSTPLPFFVSHAMLPTALPDLDGDGIRDFALRTGTGNGPFHLDPLLPPAQTSTFHVESGATGATLLATTATGRWELQAGGDLDGDALPDLLLHGIAPTGTTAYLDARAGPGLGLLWSRADAAANPMARMIGSAVPTADHTGDGIPDAAYFLWESYDAGGQILAIDGATGAATWTRDTP